MGQHGKEALDQGFSRSLQPSPGDDRDGSVVSCGLLTVEALCKSYGGYEAVGGVDFHVRRGEIFALLGPNGAGKTTIIRMIMGVLRPSSGTATVGGLDCLAQRVECMRHIGYLPDEPVFQVYMKGQEIIRFAGEMHGLSSREVGERMTALVPRFGLQKDMEEYAVNYSKGMKKRLGLICALLHDPDLLILDEPTNGLDPFATRCLHELMLEKAAQGKSVFFSTHLLEQAQRLSHRVGILHRGKIAAMGSLGELRDQLCKDGSLEEIFFPVAGE